MVKKDLNVSNLLSIYGAVLDVKAREVLLCYYDYDMSLSEIAENMDMTRQGVHSFVLKYTEELKHLEFALRLQEKYKEVDEVLTELILSSSDQNQKLLQKVKGILNY